MVSARQVRNQILLTTEWNGGEQLTRRTHWIPEWWGEWGECVSGNIWGMRDYGKETCSILNLCRNQPVKSITHSTYKAALYCSWHNSTHCLTQKPHHTSRIPLTPVHGADGSAGLRGGRGAWCGMDLLCSSSHPHGWMFAHFMRCEADPLLGNSTSWMTSEKQVIPGEEVSLEMQRFKSGREGTRLQGPSRPESHVWPRGSRPWGLMPRAEQLTWPAVEEGGSVVVSPLRKDRPYLPWGFSGDRLRPTPGLVVAWNWNAGYICVLWRTKASYLCCGTFSRRNPGLGLPWNRLLLSALLDTCIVSLHFCVSLCDLDWELLEGRSLCLKLCYSSIYQAASWYTVGA